MRREQLHGRASWSRRRGGGPGRLRRPAVSEILSVIMITAALGIGTGVFLYTFLDRQDVSEEATLGHIDLSRMRASELVTWSSAQCTADGRLEFLLHNYGAENLSTADIRMYGSSMGRTKEIDGAAASYYTLSNRTITGLDIPGGETAWASVGLGCDALPGTGFSWECDNPLLRHPAYMGCSGTLLSMVTPAEDIVRVRVDGADGAPPMYPTTSYIVPAATGPGQTTTRVCFDVSGQPRPLTGIEVWNFGRGNFPSATVADNLVANFSGAGITPGPDAGTSCIDLPRNAYYKLLRFRMVSDDGASLFNQRPYAMIHGTAPAVDHLRVANRDASGFESFFHCPSPNGQVIPADGFSGRC